MVIVGLSDRVFVAPVDIGGHPFGRNATIGLLHFLKVRFLAHAL